MSERAEKRFDERRKAFKENPNRSGRADARPEFRDTDDEVERVYAAVEADEVDEDSVTDEVQDY